MTCIVLVQNPGRGGILAITGGIENDEIEQWPDAAAAAAAVKLQPLVQAWGGYVVDLERMEVTEL